MSVLSEQLQAEMRAEADSIEITGQISSGLLGKLKSVNAFTLLLPQTIGGRQLPYPEFIEVVKLAAQCDGSLGWCINQGSVLSSLSSQLPVTAARHIWCEPGTAIANGPPGQCLAVPVAGGYQLTGNWTFSSGINHAAWLGCVAPIDGSHEVRWFCLPKEQADIDGRWPVNGLKGTGSYGFSVEDLHVPDDYTFVYQLAETGPSIYKLPLNLLFACGFASVALGVSRGALDFAVERANNKRKRFEKKILSQHEPVQAQIGRAETLWRAADCFLTNEVGRVWDRLESGGDLTQDDRIAMRMAGTHVIRQAKDIVDIAYAICSTDSIFTHNEIQRRFQDIHVITQHLQGRTDIYGLVGRHFLGLDVNSPLL